MKVSMVISLLKRQEFIFALRIFLGVLFIYASYDKILRPDQFAIAVRAYKIIPLELSNLFALMLAWSELIAGAFLVLGILTRESASAVLILLVMFIAAITISLVRGLVIDCSCFRAGDGGQPVDIGLLVRDLFLLTAAFLVIIYDRGFLSVQNFFVPRSR